MPVAKVSVKHPDLLIRSGSWDLSRRQPHNSHSHTALVWQIRFPSYILQHDSLKTSCMEKCWRACFLRMGRIAFARNINLWSVDVLPGASHLLLANMVVSQLLKSTECLSCGSHEIKQRCLKSLMSSINKGSQVKILTVTRKIRRRGKGTVKDGRIAASLSHGQFPCFGIARQG